MSLVAAGTCQLRFTVKFIINRYLKQVQASKIWSPLNSQYFLDFLFC